MSFPIGWLFYIVNQCVHTFPKSPKIYPSFMRVGLQTITFPVKYGLKMWNLLSIGEQLL